jgi:hypothetical protein
VVPVIRATDTVAVEVEDVGVGAEIDQRHSTGGEIEHPNERVVLSVVWALILVLHDRRGAIGVENDQKLASRVGANTRALVEGRHLGRRCRRVRGARGASVDTED